ncbi:MAG: LuxR C-terminal-related transcriptional regulator [Polyangiales bacterium]
MERVTSHAIDLIVAAYELEKPDSTWLADLIDVGEPILDQGHGIFAFEFVLPPETGGGVDAVLRCMRLKSMPPDFPARFHAARSLLEPGVFKDVTPAGYVGTWTKVAKGHPEVARKFLDTLGYADVLGILAVDPNGVGVHIAAPLSEATKLSLKFHRLWQMLGAHIAAAFRLRRALSGDPGTSRPNPTSLPCDAEAVFDADGFRMVQAVGRAADANAAEVLRKAACNVDRARRELRNEDPQQALETWQALVCGRWTLVDWFDKERRRFILAMPNPPEVRDPRGLTEQEAQVVMYTMLGETGKLIAYRLGLSTARVSGLLRSAMHKLGVHSKSALVQKLGPLGVPEVADEREPAA